MYGIKRKKSKNPTEQVRKTKDKKDMARMRRSSEQTLEYKIEQAEAKVAKTKEAHEKAVDELKKLYDIRMASTELGASAELRGLDSSNPRSCIYNIGFTYKDILAILGFVLGCIGVMLGVRTWLS